MARISSKNQITIPVDVMRQTGLEPGDAVIVRPSDRGRFEVEGTDDLIERYAGSMPSGTWPPGEADRLRDEWER